MPSTALLFADIAGSVRLFEQLGNDAARELTARTLTVVRETAARRGGEVMVTVGDEIGCLFPDAESAATAASEVQSALDREAGGRDASHAPRLRIGLHVGSVTRDEDPLLAEPTAMARWTCSLAKAEQILASRQFVEALQGVYRSMARAVEDASFDITHTEPMDLYELVWNVDAVTVCPADLAPAPVLLHEVRLRHAGRGVSVSAERPLVIVGRAPDCTLMVSDAVASRHHFQLEFARGRCMLTDKSTNGTWLVVDGAAPVAVRRETVPVRGRGFIFFGEPGQGKLPLRFQCVAAEA